MNEAPVLRNKCDLCLILLFTISVYNAPLPLNIPPQDRIFSFRR
jgi:hypothetical protein